MNTNPVLVRSRRFRLVDILPAALALLCTGCTGVYVSRPIGDQPHALVPADWEGTWTLGKGALVAHVTDAAGGKLHYSVTSVRDGAFATTTTEVVVRESGGWLFANIPDESNPERYEWARVKMANGQIFVWRPDQEAFRALVQGGKLKGQLIDKDVTLEPLSAEQMKALTTGALGAPFKWDEPFVFHRLGD